MQIVRKMSSSTSSFITFLWSLFHEFWIYIRRVILEFVGWALIIFTTIYIYIYEVHTISFQTFFVQAFNIVLDSWKFSMLLQYILWDDWPIFMILGLKEQLQHQLEYTLLKPDSYSWWISKMQSDTSEERYAIKFCFKLVKNVIETYGMF